MRKKAVREDDEESEGTKFFACYLLTSLSPRHKGHTYIGFTVNPRRRIRQHNGELMCGAWRTKNKRPWEMVLCIYGFPTNVSALQFEWAWQHPKESLAVRKAASAFKSFSGVANKIKLAYTMLNLPSWQSLNLRVNYFSTKYSKHSAGCPGLPEHMKIQICPMDELPCYVEGPGGLIENEDWEGSLEVDEDGNASRLHEQQLTDLTIHNQQADELSEHLPIIWEDCGLQFGITESPAQTSPSVNSRSLCTQEGPSIEGISSESGQLLEEKSYTAPTTDKNEEISRVGASQEIEVIELLTPSPSCTISATAKRRRVATLYPEIIDLTKSPIFV